MRNAPTRIPASLELLNGDQRFQILVEAVKDYAIYLLDAEGHVSSWNTGAQRFKGYTADEILGQHFSRFYTEEDLATGLPARALRTAAEEGRFEAEGWRVRKDGTRFWTSVVIDPIFTDAGELIGFAKITRDITERRRAQEEIEKTREALAHAQKMEAIGRLTGGVAHDFNNLLTIICSSADLLRRPDLSEEKKAKYVDAIAETADRAALLTKQLLAFARRQPLQPELFALDARIEGLRQLVATVVGSRIDVVIEVDKDVGWVEADPNQFETAILNMVINARDAMPDGGTLKISAHAAERLPAVRTHGAVEGPFVAIQIADSGTGIEAGTLEHIFEPFFTTKGINKGTGLGLSQVYGFAKQSGGEIDVASRVGEGTIFTLYLPGADPDEARQVDRKAIADQQHEAGRAAILIVEDNEIVGKFAVGLLTELGHSATWATDAKQALEILETRGGEFNLVFSDVVMPDMSGVELAQLIRSRWPELPVVLTSGYSHVLAEEGSHGFELLQKPYSVEGLLKILQGRSGR
jgi:PAS domain S-box-containing protein